MTAAVAYSGGLRPLSCTPPCRQTHLVVQIEQSVAGIPRTLEGGPARTQEPHRKSCHKEVLTA